MVRVCPAPVRGGGAGPGPVEAAPQAGPGPLGPQPHRLGGPGRGLRYTINTI
jgi:hypothetical protein